MSGASKAVEESQPVLVKRAGAGPVQADGTVKVLNLSRTPKQNLVRHLTRYPSQSS